MEGATCSGYGWKEGQEGQCIEGGGGRGGSVSRFIACFGREAPIAFAYALRQWAASSGLLRKRTKTSQVL